MKKYSGLYDGERKRKMPHKSKKTQRVNTFITNTFLYVEFMERALKKSEIYFNICKKIRNFATLYKLSAINSIAKAKRK
ncbi:hypothetical protein CBG57_11440 [Prevotella nigrescens]|nr:hypothetical protein HMPREF9419_2334 [Prevotella nigrescens ATCC 33563]OWP28980.1 hypothetical protein CBG57_11440 [Prevotella nigrescens]RKW52551.1 MAG: hypothetical protein D8B57_08185 [Prevotella sp.]